MNRHLCWTLMASMLLTTTTSAQSDEETLDESMRFLQAEFSVQTATQMDEKLSDAPAVVIVLTKDDLRQRGYRNLLEIFNDLPGMQLALPFGDTYFKNYWRGYRNTIGSPYLVLVDGLNINSLYYGNNDYMAAMPLSNVERVEVVYGPASSVYGANASMGVVNILTVKDQDGDGVRSSSRVLAGPVLSEAEGPLDDYVTDFSIFYKQDKLRLSLSGFIENGDLNNRIDNETFYWLRDEHYADPALWGDYLNNPMLNAGKFSSYIRNRGFDGRLFFDKYEIGFQSYLLDTGYGLLYPADRITSQSMWPRFYRTAYAKLASTLIDGVDAQTLIRWRSDGVSNDALDLEGYNITNRDSVSQMLGGVEVPPGERVRVVALTSWQTLNSSWSIHQDFDIRRFKSLALKTGFRLEQKNLQKAYDLDFSPALYPPLVDASDPAIYPEPAPAVYQYGNRIIWQERGFFLQGKYPFSPQHHLNFGLRVDYNSAYGTNATIRAGYVRHWRRFTGKLLYGEAFQEPVPRNLYGGWTGSGSDPDLKPEESKTYELNLSYQGHYVNGFMSLYQVNIDQTVIGFTGGARNAGDRRVIGLDAHFQRIFPLGARGKVQAWAYGSFLLKEEEQKFNLQTGEKTGKERIGDLAHQQIHWGLTAIPSERLDATVRGRYVGQRRTVATNPLAVVDGYWTLDATLNLNKILSERLSASVQITNLFNAAYFHPGIREANSGEAPGEWRGYAWYGSKGWYNSKLPQPHRQILLSLNLAMD